MDDGEGGGTPTCFPSHPFYQLIAVYHPFYQLIALTPCSGRIVASPLPGLTCRPYDPCSPALPCGTTCNVRAGWELQGVMCNAADIPPGRTAQLGQVWKCPPLAPLPGSGGRWLLAVSPYPCSPPHAPPNPVLFWVGRLGEGGAGFDMRGTQGPLRLDRGDCLYAPNVCLDPDTKVGSMGLHMG